MKSIALTLAIMVICSCNAFSGELPTVTVFDVATNKVIMDADSALYESKFDMWTFFDSLSKKSVEMKADAVRIYNMNGEYHVVDGSVFHRNSGTKKETRIAGNVFEEVMITTDLDNSVVDNEL